MFFSPENFVRNQEIQLEEETSKHIIQVLRMKIGGVLRLTNGAGLTSKAEIIDDHKKKSKVKIIEVTSHERKTQNATIAISLLKNASRFEWFLEKSTEIGVSRIIPLLCERTEKSHIRIDRMKNILVSAMLQSQQSWLPELSDPQKFISVVENANEELKLIAHCVDEQKRDIKEIESSSSRIILIGPEGDFTKNEIETALSKQFIPVTLGQTRLRSETAGLVAAAHLA